MTETSSHRYKPRNIINAPNVKSSIFSRSQQRGDSEIIQRWLSNHFYRWIIGDFPMFILCDPSPIMPFILALMQKSPPGWRQSWVAMSAFTTLMFSTRNLWQWKEI